MIILTGNPGATRMIMASAERPPEESFALLMLALLVLALGYGACARAARRDGKTLREWWESLR
jgi:hypothetical protein